MNYTSIWWRTVMSHWRDWTNFFACQLYFFDIHSSLFIFFLCFFVLFESRRSHAQVFGRTLVPELHIFRKYTEWNLLSSLYDNDGDNAFSESILKEECFKLNSKKNIYLLTVRCNNEVLIVPLLRLHIILWYHCIKNLLNDRFFSSTVIPLRHNTTITPKR